MTDEAAQFRSAKRGYEPEQVDRRIRELTEAAAAAQRRSDELAEHVGKLEAERMGEAAPAPATFDHLGERVAQILRLAEDEAGELRGAADADAQRVREEAAEASGSIRAEADRYADGTRTDAETEAARILEDARRTSDDLIDSGDRNATARMQEAEALYEEQRARAAKAAADFETTLAERKKATEAEFTKSMTEAQQRHTDLEQQIEQRRKDAESEHSTAASQARRLVEEAERQAATIVGDARTIADRIRADSDRELAAATQRRDSINAQLANVRQMLVTLTGSAPAALLDEQRPEQSPDAGGPVPAEVLVDEEVVPVEAEAETAEPPPPFEPASFKGVDESEHAEPPAEGDEKKK